MNIRRTNFYNSILFKMFLHSKQFKLIFSFFFLNFTSQSETHQKCCNRQVKFESQMGTGRKCANLNNIQTRESFNRGKDQGYEKAANQSSKSASIQCRAICKVKAILKMNWEKVYYGAGVKLNVKSQNIRRDQYLERGGDRV